MKDVLRRTIYNRSWVLDVMVGILLITTIYFLVGQRNQTESLNDIAQQNHLLNMQNNDLLSRIKSCTDPDGTCYRDNTTRTAGAVDNINKITVYAAVCADKDGVQTVVQIKSCVEDLLKQH